MSSYSMPPLTKLAYMCLSTDLLMVAFFLDFPSPLVVLHMDILETNHVSSFNSVRQMFNAAMLIQETSHITLDRSCQESNEQRGRDR